MGAKGRNDQDTPIPVNFSFPIAATLQFKTRAPNDAFHVQFGRTPHNFNVGFHLNVMSLTHTKFTIGRCNATFEIVTDPPRATKLWTVVRASVTNIQLLYFGSLVVDYDFTGTI